jgi:hypothetical protein
MDPVQILEMLQIRRNFAEVRAAFRTSSEREKRFFASSSFYDDQYYPIALPIVQDFENENEAEDLIFDMIPYYTPEEIYDEEEGLLFGLFENSKNLISHGFLRLMYWVLEQEIKRNNNQIPLWLTVNQGNTVVKMVRDLHGRYPMEKGKNKRRASRQLDHDMVKRQASEYEYIDTRLDENEQGDVFFQPRNLRF